MAAGEPSMTETAPNTALDWPAMPAFSDPAAMQSLAANIFVAVVLMLLLTGLYRIAPRVWRVVEETLLTNWRLGLLAATGLVLSLASGWTTWDGMRNFTSEPLLSVMITFGIQGVMLIIAWIIGESFATGMNQRPAGAPHGTLSKSFQAATGGLIGVLLFVALSAMLLQQGSQTMSGPSPQVTGIDSMQMSEHMLIIVVGLLLAALVALYSASDVVKPYLQSSRVIAKNTVLWVMFLACMATSVFFSFDSLFSAIFPQSERERAAELRAQNQVAGIVSDIGTTIERRRLTSADELFRSEGWRAYETQLDALTSASRGAEGLIEAYYVEKMEERRRSIAEQHERIASSESNQAGLSLKKSNLTEEISRLEAERPALVTDLQSRRNDLDQRAKEVDAKRVEAMAEEKGVEGTLRQGRGPIYRERLSELSKLQDYYKIGEQRVNDAQKRLDDTNGRIDALKRELAEIDGALAKLKGEADTAQQRIAVAATATDGDATPKVDPARVLPAFEASRIAFRQNPTVDALKAVQDQCTQLLNAMSSAPVTKERVAAIDCDPRGAQEAAGVLFALNSGARLYAGNCVGGDKLAANTSTDQLFGFARKCLADSGLPSRETDDLRSKINFVELNRDDKAHRFVVTWNAFQDGNRLAYLALAIAIAIDALIFMSGLFGANAVRSPLSDVPSHKARSAQQLEDIIHNALLPDTFENARLALQSFRPITNIDGFTSEVRLSALDPHSAGAVRAVLNAGTTIHAVEYDRAEDRYLVRAELFEFLSSVSRKAFESNAHHATTAELEKIVAVSLLPDIGANVDIVLSYIHPIPEAHGFTAELKYEEVKEADQRTVLNLLNAGSVHQRVQRAGTTGRHYYIHRDLYKALAALRARSLFSSSLSQPALAPPPPTTDEVFGGSLDANPVAITHQSPPSGADLAEDAEMAPPSPAFPPPLPSNAERQTVREALIMKLGLPPSAYSELVRGEALAFAIGAAQQLRRLCRRQPTIGVHIETEISYLRSDLERGAAELKQEGYDRSLVDLIQQEIDDVLPALLLVQSGRYQSTLNDLIAELEIQDGEGRLAQTERNFLYRLRMHESALSKLPRAEPGDWQRVANLLEALGSDTAEPRFDTNNDALGGRRPN